jgi:pimeloyl-ACP methyl ester carboxylesterase
LAECRIWGSLISGIARFCFFNEFRGLFQATFGRMRSDKDRLAPFDGECRVYSNPGKPVLVYLPGIHGDSTLFTSFRLKALRDFEVVEFDYPRSTVWTLEDYSSFVTQELRRHKIKSAWILAESYSSQVAWTMLERPAETHFVIEGIILAGGFVRYPIPALAALTASVMEVVPHPLWKILFSIYGRSARFRHRRAPETKAAVDEFIRRRTREDLAAMVHRIRLIVKNDPSEIARRAGCPVYLLAGVMDPVVFAWPVLVWLRGNCAGFSGHRFVWPADHNVLGTEPAKAFSQVLDWTRMRSMHCT